MSAPKPPFDPAVRARTLLAYLWRKYDAAGTSMGRSHEAVLLETAMDLLGYADPNELVDDYGEQVGEARDFLSARRAAMLGFEPGETYLDRATPVTAVGGEPRLPGEGFDAWWESLPTEIKLFAPSNLAFHTWKAARSIPGEPK